MLPSFPYSLYLHYKMMISLNCVLRTQYHVFFYCFIVIISKCTVLVANRKAFLLIFGWFLFQTIFPNSKERHIYKFMQGKKEICSLMGKFRGGLSGQRLDIFADSLPYSLMTKGFLSLRFLKCKTYTV